MHMAQGGDGELVVHTIAVGPQGAEQGYQGTSRSQRHSHYIVDFTRAHSMLLRQVPKGSAEKLEARLCDLRDLASREVIPKVKLRYVPYLNHDREWPECQHRE